MTTLARIREKLQQQDNKQNFTQQDNVIFPHWSIPDNSTAKLRFLEDGDPNNEFFWVERQMIRLPFSGIKGSPDSKPVTVTVPCMEMWGEACPILTEIRPWFKDSNLEELARKYWKKRSYVFQGFVRETELEEENAPENPIRKFILTPQLFKLVKAALLDPEVEEIPTHPENGLDFLVTKTKGAQFAEYGTSKWARKESSLTSEEKAAIEQYGLFNLTESLPNKPNEEAIKVITAMFEASVDGDLYDPDLWAAYFRPPGVSKPGSESNDSSSTEKTQHVVKKNEVSEDPRPQDEDDEDDADADNTSAEDEVPETKSSGNSKANEILAKIKARKAS